MSSSKVVGPVQVIRPTSRRIEILRGLALLLAATLLGAGSFSWWRGRPERYLAEARRQLDSGDPEGAIAWLSLPESVAATRDPALLLRARAALERQRPREAIAPIDRVDPSGPWAVDADFWKGRTLYAAKDPKLAIAWFRRVVKRRPDDLEARRWLAAASYDLGDWESAVATLRVVTRREPTDPRAWRTLGTLYLEENELAPARDAFEVSLRAAPDQPQVQLDLAKTLVKMGRFVEAARHLAACRGKVAEGDRLELDVQCLRGQGEQKKVQTLVDAAMDVFPSHPGLCSQHALIARAQGRPAIALESIDRALAGDPNNAQALYLRGLILRDLGRADESDRDLARSSEINRQTAEMADLNTEANDHPDDPGVRCRLGRVCIQLGNPKLAAFWYRAALACDREHAEAKAGLNALGAR